MILSMVFKKCFTDMKIFEHRPEEGDRESPEIIWGEKHL